MDSGVLRDGVFFDKDFTYIDSLTDGEVMRISRHVPVGM